jgi:hypothetical protein
MDVASIAAFWVIVMILRDQWPYTDRWEWRNAGDQPTKTSLLLFESFETQTK